MVDVAGDVAGASTALAVAMNPKASPPATNTPAAPNMTDLVSMDFTIHLSSDN